MRLADFIERQLPAILAAWESFAATLLPAADGLDAEALRDHAEQMLRAIAADLRTEQTSQQQAAKSRGEQMRPNQRFPRTAAELHAVLRAGEDFSVEQLVSEYRALRASVLKLYADAHAPVPDKLADIGRFNEAVDQAIAESVAYFSAEVDRWREVFLAVLAHDLRGPLDAILTTTHVLTRQARDPVLEPVTRRLARSGERLRDLLDDLVVYNRSALGLGIAVKRGPCDLAAVCEAELDLRRSAHPDADLRLEGAAPVTGDWDASRLRQLVGNLVTNAVKYGTRGEPVTLVLDDSDPAEVRLSVRNRGDTLSRETLATLFQPLRRVPADASGDERRHLGLGLFVVREIARAHGGRVDCTSCDGVTEFVVRLPRRPSAQRAGAATDGPAPQPDSERHT